LPGPVSDAVDQAFRDDNDGIDDFLKELRETWRDLPLAIGKAITRCIVLMALFELLLRGAVESAPILGIKISDLSLLRIAIPVIVAYGFYDIVALSFLHLDFLAVHRALMRKRHGAIEDARLDYFLQPSEPSLVGASFFEPSAKQPGRILSQIGDGLYLGWLGGLILFQCYAYAKQFELPGYDVELWIALALSGFFTLYGLFVAVTHPESSRQ
jgi:hypothetical protein